MTDISFGITSDLCDGCECEPSGTGTDDVYADLCWDKATIPVTPPYPGPVPLFLTMAWNTSICGARPAGRCECLFAGSPWTLNWHADAMGPNWYGWMSDVITTCTPNPDVASCTELCARFFVGCINTLRLWLVCHDCSNPDPDGSVAYPHVLGDSIQLTYEIGGGSAPTGPPLSASWAASLPAAIFGCNSFPTPGNNCVQFHVTE